MDYSFWIEAVVVFVRGLLFPSETSHQYNSICDVTPSAPTLYQLLQTISLFGRWSDRDIAHFITATRNTIEGAGEKREQTNNMLGVNSKCKTRSYVRLYIPVSIYRLTLAWISSENSTTLLECRLILTRLPSLLWTSSHPTGLSAPVSTGHSRHPSPTAFLELLCTTLWLAFPSWLPVTRDLESKTLCLVSRQNRQRNRLLGGPPT